MRRPSPSCVMWRILPPLLIAMIIMALWSWLAYREILPVTILPPPDQVARRLIIQISSGRLLYPLWVTISESLLGAIVGTMIGIPLAWLIAHSSIVEAAVNPYLAASQAIPAIAIAPLLVIWLGYGLAPIVVLCAIMVIFPVVISTTLGLNRLDRNVLNAAELDGADRYHLARWMEWPMALPAILSGIRNGFTLSVTGAVVGELVMGGRGLGQQLAIQSQANDITGLFATIIVLCLVAVAIFGLLKGMEWLFDPYASRARWRLTARKGM